MLGLDNFGANALFLHNWLGYACGQADSTLPGVTSAGAGHAEARADAPTKIAESRAFFATEMHAIVSDIATARKYSSHFPVIIGKGFL